MDVVRDPALQVPILGVCLGHLAIGEALGASIEQCGPQHGMASEITHDGRGLFAGCASPMKVGRYHSLALVPSSLPAELEVTAESCDGVVMGIRHRERPVYGVQFHPESVLTDEGSRIIQNFVAMTDCGSALAIDREAVR